MLDKPHSLETPVGFGKLVGYRLTAWDHDHAELELHLEARHLNRSNVPHGGVVTTLLDTVCGYAGTFSAEPGRIRRAVTLTLTTSFLGQAVAGSIITARARRTGGGQTVFFARGELVDAGGRLIATAEGTFKYLRGSEHPKHPDAK
jgi:uncharacterized protein (TIGR00369 family)